VSRWVLDKFVKDYKLECKNVKNKDAVRIAQMTLENCDALFFRLDKVCKLVHSIDPANCPWKTWEDVPDKNKFNLDKMGSVKTSFNPTNIPGSV